MAKVIKENLDGFYMEIDIFSFAAYNLIFDTYEERKVPQPLENTGLWHFVPWN